MVCNLVSNVYMFVQLGAEELNYTRNKAIHFIRNKNILLVST